MIDQSLETDRETRERVWNVLRNSTITIHDMAGSEEDLEARDGFYHEVLLDEQRRKEDRETDRELQKITRVSDWHWARMWARRPYRRLDNRQRVRRTRPARSLVEMVGMPEGTDEPVMKAWRVCNCRWHDAENQLEQYCSDCGLMIFY